MNDESSWPQNYADEPYLISAAEYQMNTDLATLSSPRSLYDPSNPHNQTTPYHSVADQDHGLGPYYAESSQVSQMYPEPNSQNNVQYFSSLATPTAYTDSALYSQTSQSYALTNSVQARIFEGPPSVSTGTPAFTEASFNSGSGTREGKVESVAKLLYCCLLEAPRHTRLLGEIYDWFIENGHSDKISHDSRTNTIRHNLSINGDFLSVGKESGKKAGWALTDEALVHGSRSTTWWRKKKNAERRETRPSSNQGTKSSTGGRRGRSAATKKMPEIPEVPQTSRETTQEVTLPWNNWQPPSCQPDQTFSHLKMTSGPSPLGMPTTIAQISDISIATAMQFQGQWLNPTNSEQNINYYPASSLHQAPAAWPTTTQSFYPGSLPANNQVPAPGGYNPSSQQQFSYSPMQQMASPSTTHPTHKPDIQQYPQQPYHNFPSPLSPLSLNAPQQQQYFQQTSAIDPSLGDFPSDKSNPQGGAIHQGFALWNATDPWSTQAPEYQG